MKAHASILALLLFAPILPAESLPPEWQYHQEIPVTSPGLTKILLPPETLDASKLSLEDLRILDPKGHPVPFHVDLPIREPESSFLEARNFRMELVDGFTRITLETGNRASPIQSIILKPAAVSFIKSAKLEGSSDGKTWKILAENLPLFQQGGASQSRLMVPSGSWNHIRITMDDRKSDPVAFTGAVIETRTSQPRATIPLPVQILESNDTQTQTRLLIDLGARNLTLASLEFETSDPLFTRKVSLAIRRVTEAAITEQVLHEDSIHRINLEKGTSSTRLNVDCQVKIPSRELLVLIQNDDNPPLRITGVKARQHPIHLIFMANEPGRHQLLSGSSAATRPQYDVSRLVNKTATAHAVIVTPGISQVNPAWRPPPPLPDVTPQGAAIDLAGWTFRKPIQAPAPGLLQLELDPEVITGAVEGFRDLRVIQGGLQLPYILEHTSIRRRLSPEVKSMEAPARMTRWEISIPTARMPLSTLSCRTTTTVFRRLVTLYEEQKDERGNTYRHVLGQATWARISASSNPLMSLPITSRPKGNRLVLEMDNGDNPALPLDAFQLEYPVTRVLSKCGSTSDLFLYYGNPRTHSPDYDLQMIASQVLATAKTTAALGAQENLKESWSPLSASTAKAPWLFWLVLGGVVIVLLLVIRKLLPEPPAK